MSEFQSGYPEEVFRFSVVRNPVIIPSDKLPYSVVEIIIPVANEVFKYTTALAELKRNGAQRQTIVNEAKRMIAAPEFLDELENIRRPMWRYIEALQALPKLSFSVAYDLIEKIFEMDVTTLATDNKFIADREIISDSLVLASVVEPPLPGLRTRLMWARRAIAFIEFLANPDHTDKNDSEKLLKATLLLPGSVFPIPEERENPGDRNKKIFSRKKAAIERQNARLQRLLDKLNHNTVAMDELSNSLDNHLFEQLHGRVNKDTKAYSVLMLPAAKFKILSPETKKVVLEELSLEETNINVPYVINQIERINLKLGKQLTMKFGQSLAELSPLCSFGCQNIGECKGVIIPPPDTGNDFNPETRGEVEVLGYQELFIVRQSLFEYRAGEISHIENVLQSEKKSTTHRKLDRTEVTTTQETEKEQLLENELQTTDKYELQSQASQVIHDDRHLEAGVTVTGSYGPVNIETHGNYASNSSAEESKNSASTYARDVTSRSLQRIRERVLNRRTRTEISEIEIINLHEFVNTQQNAQNISGIYRWVDKFYEAQIVNYGKRMMLEFMIPEPAAFYKYASTKKPEPVNVLRPDTPGFCCNSEFHPLSPEDVRPDNYLCFVAKYNARNVTGPPPKYVYVSDVLKYNLESTTQEVPVSFGVQTNPEAFKIPDGYFPKSVAYNISGANTHSAGTEGAEHDDNILVEVTIGNQKVFSYYKNEHGKLADDTDFWPDIGQITEWGKQLTQVELDFGSYSEGNVNGEVIIPWSDPVNGVSDSVIVSMIGQSSLPFSAAVHYSVLCECSPTKFQKWQMDTFTSIMDAYQLIKEDYEDALKEQENETVQNLEGRNPLLNREIEKRELKKFSISLLTGQQYDSFNAMEYDYQIGIPQIDLSDAVEEGKFVRFFEQALEWTNMTYLFYPYFWGRKRNWAETIMIQNSDPLFEQFLKAGYSRVWVPVRPGFESIILNYIECGGEPWSERDPPLIGEPNAASAPTVAMIEEIKEQLGMNLEFRAGVIDVRNHQKLIVGHGTDFRKDDIDREILINLKYYRISYVNEASQELELRYPYQGGDEDGVGFAIGIKFVGEPWLVQVPTTLLYLSRKNDLITE